MMYWYVLDAIKTTDLLWYKKALEIIKELLYNEDETVCSKNCEQKSCLTARYIRDTAKLADLLVRYE